MSEARLTKTGLLIPRAWIEKLGDEVRVQRSGNVLIVESRARAIARKRLARLARGLRTAGRKLGAPGTDEVEALVREVRAARAGGR